MPAVARAVLFLGLCVGLAVAADPPADLRGKQAQNAEQFRLIKGQLIKLAQKLAASDKPAERDRAKVILAAVELANRERLDRQFEALAGELGKDAATVNDLERAIGQDGQLLKALQDMLALLLSDDEGTRQKAEIDRITQALKEARDIARQLDTLRTLTDAQKADAAKLAESQRKLADRTEKLADGMAGGKAAERPNDGKPGDSKDGKNSPGKGKDGKSGEDESGGEPKDGKSGEQKDGKPSAGKDQKGKGGQPKDGKPAEPKAGSDSRPQDGKPSDQQQQQMPGRQRVQQAVRPQQQAADDLRDEKPADAGRQQDKALDELNKAVQEMEKRLRQLREEEAMRQLAGLEARCAKMLRLQQAVYDATKALDAAMTKSGTKSDADIKKVIYESDREREIVGEADKALELLKAEGSAVSFAGVLREVREDMAGIQRRLGGADPGPVTQEIEANVIALLGEMVAALKKQQQDMQQQQQQQAQQQQGQPPNQALVNKIAELKLIKSLQTQVNARTKVLGGKSAGEQAADPQLAADLRTLAERQAKIQQMLAALASDANQ